MSGQALHACRAALKIPLFGRTSGFLVCPDRGAIKERHSQPDPVAVLRQFQQTVPDTMTAPTDKGLCRHPPRSQMRRDTAPFGPIRMPPDNRLDGAAQVLVLRFVRRTALIDQRCKGIPLRVRQHTIARVVSHTPNIGIVVKS